MKRAFLALALMAAAVATTLTPDTAEAQRRYRGGYYGRPYYSRSYSYRPYTYGYSYARPYYRSYYRPYYYNSYRPYYYNAYRPYYYGRGYYRSGVGVYGPGFGFYVR
jgi:hypothetical protein